MIATAYWVNSIVTQWQGRIQEKRQIMRTLMMAVVVLSQVAITDAQKLQPAPVSVYVTSVGAVGGLSDPNKDNQNTVKDLRNAVKDRKGLVLSEKREQADIVLVVMNREKAQITAGLFGDPARDVILRVKFIFRGSESDMTASAQGGTLSSGGAWSRAAGKISKQIEEWVGANRAAIAAPPAP